MSMEKFNSRRLLRGSVLAAAAGSLLLAGCGASSNTSANKKPTAETISLVPDMAGYLKPGSSTTCYNGGARPCAVLIRTAPKLSADYINANPNQNRVKWPLEAYAGNPGNQVQVECYDPNGELVRPYEGNSSSSDWYKVLVPSEYVLNPNLTNLQHVGAEVVGWASIEWFGESTPNRSVPSC